MSCFILIPWGILEQTQCFPVILMTYKGTGLSYSSSIHILAHNLPVSSHIVYKMVKNLFYLWSNQLQYLRINLFTSTGIWKGKWCGPWIVVKIIWRDMTLHICKEPQGTCGRFLSGIALFFASVDDERTK